MVAAARQKTLTLTGLSVALVAALAGPLAPVSASTPGGVNRLGIVTPTIGLIEKGGYFMGEVVFSISGDQPVTLEIDINDVWTNDQGRRTILPAGSTPLSAKNRLEISQDLVRYVPNGETQNVTVSLKARAEQIRTTPLAAGIKITLVEDRDPSSSQSPPIISSAMAFVFAGPEASLAALSGFAPMVVVDRLGVTPRLDDPEALDVRPLTFVESGPVAVFLDTSNLGTLFAFASHEISISKAGWWVNKENDLEVFRHEFSEAVILPEQKRQHRVDATATLTGSPRPLDVLSDWGLYSLTAETFLHTGAGQDAEATPMRTDVVYFIVFPLRQALTLLVIGGLVLILVFRAGRKAPSQADTPGAHTKDPIEPDRILTTTR